MAIISRTGGSLMPHDGLTTPYLKAGALVANDFAGQCVVGSQAIDTTTGKVYVCSATNGTTTSAWGIVTSA